MFWASKIKLIAVDTMSFFVSIIKPISLRILSFFFLLVFGSYNDSTNYHLPILSIGLLLTLTLLQFSILYCIYLDSPRQVVSLLKPREEAGMYWGYRVRYASNISSVFKDCPYKVEILLNFFVCSFDITAQYFFH
jgi:hypothetical protein